MANARTRRSIAKSSGRGSAPAGGGAAANAWSKAQARATPARPPISDSSTLSVRSCCSSQSFALDAYNASSNSRCAIASTKDHPTRMTIAARIKRMGSTPRNTTAPAPGIRGEPAKRAMVYRSNPRAGSRRWRFAKCAIRAEAQPSRRKPAMAFREAKAKCEGDSRRGPARAGANARGSPRPPAIRRQVEWRREWDSNPR